MRGSASSEPRVSAANATGGADPRGAGSSPPPGGRDGRVLRFLFHLVWICLVPFALAVLSVWLLTPPAQGGSSQPLRVFVAEQQIPAGIVPAELFGRAQKVVESILSRKRSDEQIGLEG